ncbi:hypothetical protein L6R49_12815 [Myxococcota bacterium]|nr:hypothetical protein [Myxococcota bacterium]
MRQAPTALLVLLLAACSKGAVTLTVGNDSGDAGADSAEPSGDDTASDDTGEADDTSGGEDTSPPEDTTPPEPVPDTSRYTGELIFSYDHWSSDCAGDTVIEEATAVSEDDAAAMKAACPSCTLFYEIKLDKAEVCSWINVEENDYRGLALGDGWAFVYRFNEDKGDFTAELLDSTATFDGWTVKFDTTFDYWGVDVQVVGAYTFPEAAAE